MSTILHGSIALKTELTSHMEQGKTLWKRSCWTWICDVLVTDDVWAALLEHLGWSGWPLKSLPQLSVIQRYIRKDLNHGGRERYPLSVWVSVCCCRHPRKITEFSTWLQGTKGVLRNGPWPELNMMRQKNVNWEIASFFVNFK